MEKIEKDTEVKEKVLDKKDKKSRTLQKVRKGVVTGALGAYTFGLVGSGGCGTGVLNEKSKSDPAVDTENSEILKEPVDVDEITEYVVEKEDKEDKEEKAIINYFPELRYASYDLKPSENFLNKIKELRESNGELIEYPFYEMVRQEPGYYSGRVKDLREVLGVDSDEISYSFLSDKVEFNFKEPTNIPNIDVDPSSKESIENALHEISKIYFGKEFYFEIQNMSEENGFKKVEFTRVEKKGDLVLPHYGFRDKKYLYLDDNGNFKEGRLSLIELVETGTSPIISPEVFSEILNTDDCLKAIVIRFPNPYDFGPTESYIPKGNEELEVNLENFDLVLLVRTFYQTGVAPMFIGEADGRVKIGGEYHDSDFFVSINALPPGNFEKSTE